MAAQSRRRQDAAKPKRARAACVLADAERQKTADELAQDIRQATRMGATAVTSAGAQWKATAFTAVSLVCGLDGLKTRPAGCD